ncbi:MAG: DUF1295 domain-containing protein [Asticcacaulis sp.]
MEILLLIMLAAGIVLAMTVAWAIQMRTESSGWIDVIWAFTTGLGGVTAAILPGAGNGQRRWWVAALIAAWSLRLGLHLLKRTQGKADDPRYAAIRARLKSHWSLYLFGMLQIQGACAFMLVVCVRLAATNPMPFPGLFDLAGIGLLIIAVAGEGVADAQLAQFSKTHEHAVCDIGLWRWSRHPNYFFEWLGWCAWAILAVDVSTGGLSWSLIGFVAPVLMYVLLVHVSGIPPLENHMLESRSDTFKAYQNRVNAFFPGPNNH